MRTVIVRGGSDARYLAAGYVVYSRANEILGVPFDISTLRAGNPVTLIEDEGAVQFGISADGTLVYATRRPSTTRLFWIEPGGVEVPITQQKGQYTDPRVSPDGSRIAFSNSVEGNRDVFVLDWARNLTTALTTAPGADVMPTWTPSGDRIVFGSNRDGTVYNLYWRAADGSGPEDRLTNSPNVQVPASWSKDGKTLFYVEGDPSSSDIYALAFGEPGREADAAAPGDDRGERWIAQAFAR